MTGRHVISHTLRAVALTVACIFINISAAPSAIAASFDGDWSVVVQTRDHCGTSQWGLTIIDGQNHHPAFVLVGGFPAFVAGEVSSSGRVMINVVAGPRFASGTGRLGQVRGAGRWAGRGPSGTCAGVWTATRLNAPVSAAFMRQ
jgi:hypothetical protein